MYTALQSKILPVLLVLTMLLTVVMSGVPITLAKERPERQIALVYDDSGSMIFDDNDQYQESWYRAKYAMEVFAAMMNSGDTMTVFPMSFYSPSAEHGLEPITVRGEESPDQRVQTLHDMNHDYLGTYFSSVTAACDYLKQTDASAEKWLVVLTDGYFDDRSAQDAEAYMRQQASQSGFKVIYMAIGPEAAAIASDPDAGIYGYKADTSTDILSTVTQVANQVFSRRSVPTSQITTEGDKLFLQLDVPVSELIIFAQGENVEVGVLHDAVEENSWQAASKTRVKYSDQLPQNYSDASHSARVVIDSSLQGMLADFIPEEPLAAGQYQISMANAQQVQIYYTPRVEVGLQLTDAFGNQWELRGDTQSLYSGTYTAEAYLLDPLTGKRLESQMVKLQSASVNLENNGKQLQINGLENGTQQLVLEKGNISGSITAQLDEYQTLSATFDAEVAPALWSAELETALPAAKSSYHYRVDQLEKGQAVKITVWEIDPETGSRQPMEEQDWLDALVTVQTMGIQQKKISLWQRPLYALYDLMFCREDKKLDWSVSLGEEVSTYLVQPVSGQNTNTTAWGEIQLRIELDSKGTNHSSTAQTELAVRVAPLPVTQILPAILPGLLILALLLLALLLWIRKKRLPRGLVAELRIHEYGIGSFSNGDTTQRLSVRRKFSLFQAETAEVEASLAGKLRMEKIKLCAQRSTMDNRKRTFCISNLQKVCEDTSLHPMTLNGMKIQKGDEKRLQRAGCELKCKANRDCRTGEHADCTVCFLIEKKNKRRVRQRKRRR